MTFRSKQRTGLGFGDFFEQQLKTQKDFSWVISQLKQLYFLGGCFLVGFWGFFGNKTNKRTNNETRKVAVGRVLSGWGRRKKVSNCFFCWQHWLEIFLWLFFSFSNYSLSLPSWLLFIFPVVIFLLAIADIWETEAGLFHSLLSSTPCILWDGFWSKAGFAN